ncbi:Ribosomal protein L11 methyltransferase (PrmA) [Fibrobacter sp. UWB15]|uniref:50S ribosomal protein L11 methyltransferase n=1 Tax=unclassified Fibrobacter TaxID=2634177 RepID=UPI000915F5B1|nr:MULTISPECIES: 50S ribosomal protein L11 methyltransferase [unclassified Fibrobacter]PWJ63467.1 ribosomal protein L11 methyltransferase PrmA [Fibrobacter sp. UWB6]SHG31502.1 Ribosomal protein L11 methyltransferase (PrmA) [Fibrobacter sp. UWB8]SMG36244.1 Ribosomal protein L11 methyltransferase (PrmA) [Fibrobacter sp. UWB15]
MSILVDVKKYLALEEAPKHVQDYLSVAVTDHAYLPKTEDITSDWVAYIAAPAFKLIRENLGHDVEAFASIGTGSGIDVLTGIELLGAKRVGFTDLLESVVDAAAENIRKNLKNADSIELEFGAGDLLQPLENGKRRYDVIYENLPNVPLTDNTKIEDKRNSGHYLEKRVEVIPEFVHEQMLDLHYLALKQARDYLADKGAVYSTLGGRVPLSALIKLGELAGLSSEIFTYSWKVQAEPEDVISGYAAQEKAGLGPFRFYRASDLQKAFADISVKESGKNAFEIEKSLESSKLTAKEAYEAFLKGEVIGHTVAVLKSSVK